MVSTDLRRSRRNAVVFGASAVGLGLLFLYPTSTNHGTTHRGTQTVAAGVVSLPSGTPTPTATAPPRRTAVPTATVTVNGQAADARGCGSDYGPVQVQLHIRSRHIVSADAIAYPQSSGRDQEINAQAVPQLDQETVSAQSSHIDTVSGATCTSNGYVGSLQSAIDSAHAAGVF